MLEQNTQTIPQVDFQNPGDLQWERVGKALRTRRFLGSLALGIRRNVDIIELRRNGILRQAIA